MKLAFYSLSSGNSGNCYYLGNESGGILIDAGISARRICSYLKEAGLSIDRIMGILVTHNHYDHIMGLNTLTKKYHIPVYSSDTVWKNILSISTLKRMPGDCIRKISVQQKFQLAGFDIEAFPVSHDSPETLGFHICAGSRRFTIVTDLGYICKTAAMFIAAANFLVIESNYDEQMLINGKYPPYLKNRIRGNNGHLDNQHTSDFLAENSHNGLSHICLAHLSKENNTPEKALETIRNTFNTKGKSLISPALIVLKRNVPSEIIHLEG